MKICIKKHSKIFYACTTHKVRPYEETNNDRYMLKLRPRLETNNDGYIHKLRPCIETNTDSYTHMTVHTSSDHA